VRGLLKINRATIGTGKVRSRRLALRYELVGCIEDKKLHLRNSAEQGRDCPIIERTVAHGS
jgi:hypothetical protein